MFEEKDYLTKMIEEFRGAIGKIIGLKAQNRIDESQEVLAETLKTFTNLDKEVLEALPYEILIHKVSGPKQNSERCLMLGELLKQQGDIYQLGGEEARARNSYLKSLNIIIYGLLKDDNLLTQQIQDSVDELTENIGWFKASDETKLLLFQYYELIKNYAKAEDVLFSLIDKTQVNEDLLDKGKAYYKRLLNKDPLELEEGNLPYNEVLEGLAAIEKYRTE